MPNDPALLSRKAPGDASRHGGMAWADEASGAAALNVYLSGCGRGVGLSLDARNVVTELRPDGPAARSGQLRLGDRVVAVDGSGLETPEGRRALAWLGLGLGLGLRRLGLGLGQALTLALT